MSDDLLEQSFGIVGLAYREAEERKAAAEEAARQKAAAGEAARAGSPKVYDPHRYPDSEPADPNLYEGTGIGFLYGLPGCGRFARDLGAWTLGEETA